MSKLLPQDGTTIQVPGTATDPADNGISASTSIRTYLAIQNTGSDDNDQITFAFDGQTATATSSVLGKGQEKVFQTPGHVPQGAVSIFAKVGTPAFVITHANAG